MSINYFTTYYKTILTVNVVYPNTLIVAATIPISMAPHGCTIRSAVAPTATPPARDEFCMCTMSNFFSGLKRYDIMNVVTQHDASDM